jgi:hypothetical protein
MRFNNKDIFYNTHSFKTYKACFKTVEIKAKGKENPEKLFYFFPNYSLLNCCVDYSTKKP